MGAGGSVWEETFRPVGARKARPGAGRALCGGPVRGAEEGRLVWGRGREERDRGELTQRLSNRLGL